MNKIGLRDILGNDLYIGDTVVFAQIYYRSGELDFGEILSVRDTPKTRIVTVQPRKQTNWGTNRKRSFHVPLGVNIITKIVLCRK